MFPGRVPRKMGSVEPDRKEEWPAVALAQVPLGPSRKLGVLSFAHIDFKAAPVEVPGLRNSVCRFRWRMQEALELEIRLPRRGLVLRAVKCLAASEHLVSVQHEVLRERDCVGQGSAPGFSVAVDASGRRSQPGHQAASGGVARRCLTVRSGECDATGRQLVEVRSLCLRVAAQRLNPIVQVVDADEEHVRPVGPGGLRMRGRGSHGRQNGDQGRGTKLASPNPSDLSR